MTKQQQQKPPIEVPQVVVNMVERLRSENRKLEQEKKLLRFENELLRESIAAMRDVIQTFQAKANLEGALYKTDLAALIKATNNGQ